MTTALRVELIKSLEFQALRIRLKLARLRDEQDTAKLIDTARIK